MIREHDVLRVENAEVKKEGFERVDSIIKRILKKVQDKYSSDRVPKNDEFEKERE